MQAEMVLKAAQKPGKWYPFTERYLRTARSLKRRGIIDMKTVEQGVQVKISEARA